MCEMCEQKDDIPSGNAGKTLNKRGRGCCGKCMRELTADFEQKQYPNTQNSHDSKTPALVQSFTMVMQQFQIANTIVRHILSMIDHKFRWDNIPENLLYSYSRRNCTCLRNCQLE